MFNRRGRCLIPSSESEPEAGRGEREEICERAEELVSRGTAQEHSAGGGSLREAMAGSESGARLQAAVRDRNSQCSRLTCECRWLAAAQEGIFSPAPVS